MKGVPFDWGIKAEQVRRCIKAYRAALDESAKCGGCGQISHKSEIAVERKMGRAGCPACGNAFMYGTADGFSARVLMADATFSLGFKHRAREIDEDMACRAARLESDGP